MDFRDHLFTPPPTIEELNEGFIHNKIQSAKEWLKQNPKTGRRLMTYGGGILGGLASYHSGKRLRKLINPNSSFGDADAYHLGFWGGAGGSLAGQHLADKFYNNN